MPLITSRIEKDGNWHVWFVYVNGTLRRKGWTPAGRLDAAREAAKDVRIALPLPGTANGGLSPDDVLPVVREKLVADNFLLVLRENVLW